MSAYGTAAGSKTLFIVRRDIMSLVHRICGAFRSAITAPC